MTLSEMYLSHNYAFLYNNCNVFFFIDCHNFDHVNLSQLNCIVIILDFYLIIMTCHHFHFLSHKLTK